MPKIKRGLDFVFRITEILLIKVIQFADLYTGYYRHMILDETAMADITSGESVLHIGCGSIPNTAVTLAKEIGVFVKALDNDSVAVDKARSYIQQRNLQDKINIELADGMKYSPQDYDIIIISLGVEPISKVLTNISISAKPGTQIIYRKTRYGKQKFSLPTGLSIQKKVKQRMFRIFSFTEALLLVKNSPLEKIK